MAVVNSGDTVKVHYTGFFEDGKIFDSSKEREPLEFIVGSGQVIQGFDEALIGMVVGEEKTIEIPAVNAYGIVRDDLILSVSLDQFPEGLDPKEGMVIELHNDVGGVIPAVIKKIEEEIATLDANHPLAGNDLIFELSLVEIV